MYTDGSYLQKSGGTWHLEDSPFKAQIILDMLSHHPNIQPDTICEIGCGAGGILSLLMGRLPNHLVFTGYEVSPQAHALSLQFACDRCHFILGDAFADTKTFDLVLIMDVAEHVEDCFAFLRKTKEKGRLKIYNIPLDTSVNTVIRGVNWWDSLGHVHAFTLETALKLIEYTGQRIVDWRLLVDDVAEPHPSLRSRVVNWGRKALHKANPKLSARLFGGYSVLILAE